MNSDKVWNAIIRLGFAGAELECFCENRPAFERAVKKAARGEFYELITSARRDEFKKLLPANCWKDASLASARLHGRSGPGRAAEAGEAWVEGVLWAVAHARVMASGDKLIWSPRLLETLIDERVKQLKDGGDEEAEEWRILGLWANEGLNWSNSLHRWSWGMLKDALISIYVFDRSHGGGGLTDYESELWGEIVAKGKRANLGLVRDTRRKSVSAGEDHGELVIKLWAARKAT